MTIPPKIEERPDRRNPSTTVRSLLLIAVGFASGCVITYGFLNHHEDRSDVANHRETHGLAESDKHGDGTPGSKNGETEPAFKKSRHPSKDPVKSIRSAFFNSSLTGREIEFAQLMGEMTPENAMQVRELFLEFDRSGIKSDNEWRMFWHQWAVIDPEGALNQIMVEAKNPEQGYAAGVMANIFSVWSSSDPESAKKALGRIENHWDYEASYLGLVRGLDFQDASQFAQGSEFEDLAFASKVGEALADRLLRESNSVNSMKDWYETLSGNLKTGALDHVYWRVKTADLDDAAAWMKQNAGKGVHNPRIMGEIAIDYKRKEPLKGLEWYLSLPDSEITPSIVADLHSNADVTSEIYKEWKSRNPKIRQFISAE